MAEKTPLPLKLNGESILVVRNAVDRAEWLAAHPDEKKPLYLCALALFHRLDYMDYLAIEVKDDEGEEGRWTLGYEKYELIDWMAGFALEEGSRRYHDLHQTHRRLGKFAIRYGWNPDTVVESEPSEQEKEHYIDWVTRDLDGDVGVPEDFFDDKT